MPHYPLLHIVLDFNLLRLANLVVGVFWDVYDAIFATHYLKLSDTAFSQMFGLDASRPFMRYLSVCTSRENTST